MILFRRYCNLISPSIDSSILDKEDYPVKGDFYYSYGNDTKKNATNTFQEELPKLPWSRCNASILFNSSMAPSLGTNPK